MAGVRRDPVAGPRRALGQLLHLLERVDLCVFFVTSRTGGDGTSKTPSIALAVRASATSRRIVASSRPAVGGRVTRGDGVGVRSQVFKVPGASRDCVIQSCSRALRGPRCDARRYPRGRQYARGHGTDRAARARWRASARSGYWGRISRRASSFLRPRNAAAVARRGEAVLQHPPMDDAAGR